MPGVTIRKYRKPATSTKKKVTIRKYQGAKSYPPRLAASRVNYSIGKAVSRAINQISENKITPTTNVDEATGVPIQLAAQAYTKSFCVGPIPTPWAGTTGLQSINGMTFPLGDTRQQRNGHYIYLQKTHIAMDIDMNILPGRVPLEFRLLVVKARRASNPQGFSNKFSESLFLNPSGTPVGHETSGVNGTDLLMLPVNKKDWYCYKDNKFVMSPVGDSTFGGVNPSANTSYYGSTRRLMFNLPYYKKVEVNPTTNTPDNIDFSWSIILYARAIGKDHIADNFEVNMRGSTTFKDN